MEKKIPKDDFYNELDKNRHKVNFNCVSLLIFLFFLFISGAFIVWWGIKQIKVRISKPEITISEQLLNQAENKIQSLFKKDLTPEETVTITLSDEELTSLLVKNEILSSDSKYSLKNPTAVIRNDGIEISAKLVKPIEANINAVTVPIIEDGNLKLSVQQINAGKLSMPKFISTGIENLLSRLVVDRLNNKNLYYQSVTTGNHSLIISGRKN